MTLSSNAGTPRGAAPAGGVIASVPRPIQLASVGASAFALAFGTYGACEALLRVVLPGVLARLEGRGYAMDPWMGLAFLLFYPLAGAALGAGAGVVLGLLGGRWLRAGWNARRLLLAAASGVVVLAVLGNITLHNHLARSGAVFLLVLSLFVALGAASARPAAGARSWPLLGHPFLVVPLLTTLVCATLTWLAQTGMVWRLLASAGILAAALAAVALARGRAPGRGGRAVAAACALLAVGLFAVDHDPPPPLPPLGAPGSPTADPARPPVVLIVLDTVRADHLSLYGYERSTDPNLVRFASHAWVFDRDLSPGDMTLTSHASLFTGEWVSHHGATVAHPSLPEGATTLAELLHGAGYSTMGIAANCGWLGGDHGLGQGFQYWDVRCGMSPFHGIGYPFLRTGLQEVLRRAAFPAQAAWAWRSAGSITEEALGTLDRLAGSSLPFFLFLNYMDVHVPIDPPQPYRRMFPGWMPGFDMLDGWGALSREVRAGRREVTPSERDHIVSQYDGALAYIDAQLGRIFTRLDELGLLDPSMVIITSDHGESFGSHHTFDHGDSVYQAEVDVPLVVKLPRHDEGRRIQGTVSGVDILPTIAEELGIALPTDVDGRSLIAAAPSPERPLISESYGRAGLQARGVVVGNEKLVERMGHPLELYRLDTDPLEQRNLAEHHPDLVAKLAATMRGLEDGFVAQPGRAQLKPEEEERLRALGYVEGP